MAQDDASETATDHDTVGAALWASARNLRRTEDQLDLLFNETRDLLAGWNDNGLRFTNMKDAAENGDWLATARSMRFRMTRDEDGAERRGAVTIVLQLYAASEEAEGDWPGRGVAKLIAAYTDTANAPWLIEHFDVPFDRTSDEYELDPPYLWRWDSGTETEGEAHWFFAVPMAALRSRDHVKSQVIEPLVRLINDADASTAFPSDSIAIRFEATS